MPTENLCLSLCMIVKNASTTIGSLLNDVYGVFDQIVIVDTGSTDRTVDIVKAHKTVAHASIVTLSDFEWVDDFAKARNYAMGLVEGNVMMWLDSDDRIMEPKKIRKLASRLLKEKKVGAYSLPYWYQVDEDDKPLLVHYRERLIRHPQGWEWREPLHEVCCPTFTHYSKTKVLYDGMPVLHKPKGRHDLERNWRILSKYYLTGDVTPRMTWYMQREAMSRNMPEFSIKLGQELEGEMPNSGMAYESYKTTGNAWAALHTRCGVCQYAAKAEAAYRKAIAVAPDRNEARIDLINLLITQENALDAVVELGELRRQMPSTTSAVSPVVYSSSFLEAYKAKINFALYGVCSDVLLHYLAAIDDPNPDAQCYELDKVLRAALKNNNIGVIGCHPAYMLRAKQFEQYLIDRGAFSKCIVVPSPLAVSLGWKEYYYFGHEEGLYVDEAENKCEKTLVYAERDCRALAKKAGWLAVCDDSRFDTAPFNHWHEHVDVYVFDPIYLSILPQLLEYVRATGHEKYQCFVDGFTPPTPYLKPSRNKVYMYVSTENNQLLGIEGYREAFLPLTALDEILKVRSVADVQTVSIFTERTSGIGVPWVVRETGLRTIAFYAHGIEEWDGETPYRYGIGASESSVVHLAEEFAKSGWTVEVYCPAKEKRIIAGVAYIPLDQFPHNRKWDVFVSSRHTGILDKRRASNQLFWAHDIIGNYSGLKSMVCDSVVCVSEWQRQLGVRAGMLDNINDVVIPNGSSIQSRHYASTFAQNRPVSTLWVSQPERGLSDFLDLCEKYPDDFGCVGVVYGFYNLLKSHDNEKTFKEVCALKHRMRKMGVRIYGRVGGSTLRDLMRSYRTLAYPSSFPETYCVSVAQAIVHGMVVHVHSNGATADTAKSMSRNGLGIVRFVDDKTDYVPRRDAKVWIESIRKGNQQTLPSGYSTNELAWANVCAQWKGLLQ